MLLKDNLAMSKLTLLFLNFYECNRTTRYATSILGACPMPGWAGRASGIKLVVMIEVIALIVWMG